MQFCLMSSEGSEGSFLKSAKITQMMSSGLSWIWLGLWSIFFLLLFIWSTETEHITQKHAAKNRPYTEHLECKCEYKIYIYI